MKLIFEQKLHKRRPEQEEKTRMCKSLLPVDDESLSDDAIWETLPVSLYNEKTYIGHQELFAYRSPRSPLSTHSPESDSIDLAVENSPGAIDTSIDQLYNNVCETQSSYQSPSRFCYLSYGQESHIDSELRFLAGGNFSKSNSFKNESLDENEPKIKKMNKSSSNKSSSPNIPKPNSRSKSFHDNKPPSGKKTPKKALELALRAMKSFESYQSEKPN